MNIDLKTLIAIASLIVGILLVIGPKFKEWLATNKSNPAADLFQAVLKAEPPKKVENTPLDCLEGLVNNLDQTEHKDQIDLLIDKVAPSLIRQRLKK